jgi:hypothetical protein
MDFGTFREKWLAVSLFGRKRLGSHGGHMKKSCATILPKMASKSCATKKGRCVCYWLAGIHWQNWVPKEPSTSLAELRSALQPRLEFTERHRRCLPRFQKNPELRWQNFVLPLCLRRRVPREPSTSFRKLDLRTEVRHNKVWKVSGQRNLCPPVTELSPKLLVTSVSICPGQISDGNLAAAPKLTLWRCKDLCFRVPELPRIWDAVSRFCPKLSAGTTQGPAFRSEKPRCLCCQQRRPQNDSKNQASSGKPAARVTSGISRRILTETFPGCYSWAPETCVNHFI